MHRPAKQAVDGTFLQLFAEPSFQSREVGVGQCIAAAGRPLRGSFAILPRFSASFARGVGHNPDAVATVRGANGGSWYAMPLRIIPERGQGSENVSEPASKERCDIFQQHSAWLQLANKSGHFVE
jgi:hypothetical protein